MRDCVDLHGSCKPRIVDLYPADTVAHKQIPLGPVDLFSVRKQSHHALDCPHTRLCFLD